MRAADDPEMRIDMRAAQAERIRALRNALDGMLDALAGGVESGRIDAYNPLGAERMWCSASSRPLEQNYLDRRGDAGEEEARRIHHLADAFVERAAHLLVTRITPIPEDLPGALFAACYQQDWRYGSNTVGAKAAREAARTALYRHHLPETLLATLEKEWGVLRARRKRLCAGQVFLPETEELARATPAGDRLSRALAWGGAVERVERTIELALLQAGAKLHTRTISQEMHLRRWVFRCAVVPGSKTTLEVRTAWQTGSSRVTLGVGQFLRLLREGVWVCPPWKKEKAKPSVRFLDFEITASKTSTRDVTGGQAVGGLPPGAYHMPILRLERKRT